MIDANRNHFKGPRRYHGDATLRALGAAEPITSGEGSVELTQ